MSYPITSTDLTKLGTAGYEELYFDKAQGIPSVGPKRATFASQRLAIVEKLVLEYFENHRENPNLGFTIAKHIFVQSQGTNHRAERLFQLFANKVLPSPDAAEDEARAEEIHKSFQRECKRKRQELTDDLAPRFKAISLELTEEAAENDKLIQAIEKEKKETQEKIEQSKVSLQLQLERELTEMNNVLLELKILKEKKMQLASPMLQGCYRMADCYIRCLHGELLVTTSFILPKTPIPILYEGSLDVLPSEELKALKESFAAETQGNELKHVFALDFPKTIVELYIKSRFIPQALCSIDDIDILESLKMLALFLNDPFTVEWIEEAQTQEKIVTLHVFGDTSFWDREQMSLYLDKNVITADSEYVVWSDFLDWCAKKDSCSVSHSMFILEHSDLLAKIHFQYMSSEQFLAVINDANDEEVGQVIYGLFTSKKQQKPRLYLAEKGLHYKFIIDQKTQFKRSPIFKKNDSRWYLELEYKRSERLNCIIYLQNVLPQKERIEVAAQCMGAEVDKTFMFAAKERKTLINHTIVFEDTCEVDFEVISFKRESDDESS